MMKTSSLEGCLNLRILTTVDFHIFIIIFVFEKIGLKMKDEISVVKCPGGGRCPVGKKSGGVLEPLWPYMGVWLNT